MKRVPIGLVCALLLAGEAFAAPEVAPLAPMVVVAKVSFVTAQVQQAEPAPGLPIHHKIGEFHDEITGRKYGFSVRALSELGARLENSRHYVLAFDPPSPGDRVTEADIRFILPVTISAAWRPGANAMKEADRDIAWLIASLGAPSRVVPLNELKSPDANCAAALEYDDLRLRVALSKGGQVLKFDAMPKNNERDGGKR